MMTTGTLEKKQLIGDTTGEKTKKNIYIQNMLHSIDIQEI
jgi:hypothetical protein